MIKICEKGEVKSIPVELLLKKYKSLTWNICTRWIKSFDFDQSVTEEDLHQDLMIKLHSSLSSYNYEMSSLKTFISKVSKNFFINQRSKALIKFPTLKYEENESKIQTKILYYKSLQDLLNNDSGHPLTLEDVLKDVKASSPEDNMQMTELIDNMKNELNKVNYVPNGFTKRLRTFPRLVFDTLLNTPLKFSQFVKFEYNCKLRNHEGTAGSREPRQVIPNAETMSRYFNVNIRSINRAMSLIKQTMISVNNGYKKCSLKGDQDG